MTRLQQFQFEVDKISSDFLRRSMPEAKMLHAEVCWNLETVEYTWDWTKHQIVSGLEKDFINKLEMKVCKKVDASILMIVGNKKDGMFIQGQFKRYWMKCI